MSTSAPAIQISRKGLTIWIGLVIFISFWMFVLGIMVGRGMAPVNLEAGKLEKELAELKSKMLMQEQEKEEAQTADKSAQKPELGFYEALKNPDKAAPFKPVAPPAPKFLPVPKPPAPRSVPAEPPPAVSTPEPATPPAPAPKPAPKAKTPVAAGKGHMSVQVASVQEAQGAEKLVGELRKKGYPAYQIRSEVTGKGVWFRIRVGAFEDRGAAEKMLDELKRDKYSGIVVSTQ